MSQFSTKRHLFLTASVLVLPTIGLFAATPAVAQDNKDEVIVTATRRASSVQEVPINIAAVGGAQLEEQGFDEIAEVLSYVPGINVVDQGGRNGNVLIVRGLNADPLGQGAGNDVGGTVATYLGEIPLSLDLKLNDLQRVEVLLGPQGTLYGAGTLGGAIRYIPNRPDFEKQSLEVRSDIYATKESHGISTDIGATVNVPISDTFALRASLDYLDDKGFIDYPFVVREIGVSEPDPDFSSVADRANNFSPVKDANGQQVFSGRIAARWQPVDMLDMALTYYFQNEDNEGRTTSGFRGPVPAGKFESPSRVLEPNEEKSELLALEVTADLGFAELTSATGIGKYTENGQRDQTDLLIGLEYSYETFPTFTAFTFEDEKDTFFNQELRLVSQGDHRYNWIVGGFYNKSKVVALSSEFTPGYGAFAGLNTSLNDLEYFAITRTELEEKAVFGEIGFDITDRWQITGGGRYYDYTLLTADAVPGQTTVFFPLFEGPGFAPFPLSEVTNNVTLAENQQFDDFLFKINTSYTFENGNIVYGTISEGFRIGASNGLAPCPDVFMPGPQGQCGLVPGQQFGPNAGDIAQFNELEYFPDTVTNYELGAKTTWLDGALILNAAIFYVDWVDPQVSSASVNASLPITINAEGAESKGFELNGDWRVSDRFRMRGSFSYTDTT
ncbi:MAG TPA: TonB-dependent receptor, partial [Hellea balneolensis]|nr:TonB-dependent receptor [Hellea balneolensis]